MVSATHEHVVASIRKHFRGEAAARLIADDNLPYSVTRNLEGKSADEIDAAIAKARKGTSPNQMSWLIEEAAIPSNWIRRFL